MKKFVLLLSIILVVIFAPIIKGDEISDIENQLKNLNRDLTASLNATKPLESELTTLQKRLEDIITRVNYLGSEIKRKEIEVKKGEEALDFQKKILDQRIFAYYKNAKKAEISFITLIASENLSTSLQNFFYQKTLADQDKQTIVKVIMYIKNLEDKKTSLVSENTRLASLKAEVDKNYAFLNGEVSKAKKYQSELSNTIASLTAKQQEIINARSGGFTTTIGDSNLADDHNASINGFRESAPGGYFAAFAFGAFTHRKGMSQYGARGRAQSGQDYKTILKAYYGKEPVKKDTGGDINVDGFGSMNFEDKYLMGIAEMPSSWNSEALKAQAVAARTYAYRAKIAGNSICATEACQVYNSGKADNPPDAWKRAVQDTKGEILEDVVTFYASTHGGYASPIGWDTTNGSGGGNFVDNSYDKIGGSPWLYKAWYTQGYNINSDKCGRENPWLSPEEMADIVNAAIALKTDGIDTSRITPVSSCWGGNPYSMDELKNLVAGKGGISSANSVSVSQGDGVTINVTVNGVSLSGADFKKAFNLRAPGRLSIPQSGFAFFNIEKK